MIVICDNFSYDDFPVYTNTLEEFKKEYKKAIFSHGNEIILEVYDLKINMNLQMNEDRAFHYPEEFENQPLHYPEISKVYKQGSPR